MARVKGETWNLGGKQYRLHPDTGELEVEEPGMTGWRKPKAGDTGGEGGGVGAGPGLSAEEMAEKRKRQQEAIAGLRGRQEKEKEKPAPGPPKFRKE